jgi:hypothetical protein
VARRLDAIRRTVFVQIPYRGAASVSEHRELIALLAKDAPAADTRSEMQLSGNTNRTEAFAATLVDLRKGDPQAPFPTPYHTVNPWRYVSTNPTNNPNSFDLWAEVPLGREIKIIGNWKE